MEPNEEELFKKYATFRRQQIRLVLSDKRVLMIKDGKKIFEILYSQIDRVQYNKKVVENPNDNTVSSFRLIDTKEEKIDVQFKGIDSPALLKEAIAIIQKGKKQAHAQQAPEVKAGPPPIDIANLPKQVTQNTVKGIFLEKNQVAKKMYRELVQSGVLEEEDFWNDFKVEIAEIFAYVKEKGIEVYENDSQITAQNTDSLQIQKIENIQFENKPEEKEEEKQSIVILNEEMIQPNVPIFDEYDDYYYNKNNDYNQNETHAYYIEDSNNFQEIDPLEFKRGAENFSSKINIFSQNFCQISTIEMPPMFEAISVFQEIAGLNKRRADYSALNNNNTKFQNELEKLRNHKKEQQILLLHFWKNYDNKENHEKQIIAEKIKEKIVEFRDILEEEKREVKSGPLANALIPIYREIEGSIMKIIDLY